MTFWYYMPNATSPVLLVQKSVLGATGVVWYLDQFEGEKQWRKGNAAIGSTNVEFHLEFLAVFHNKENKASAVAVDSVSFEDCSIPEGSDAEPCDGAHQFRCVATKVCIDSDQLCDHTDDCGDKSDEKTCGDYHRFCTFEMGSQCDWAVGDPVETTAARWKITSPGYRRLYFSSGPRVDHTIGVGYHGRILLLQALTSMHLDRTSDYISPTYTPRDDRGSCRLRFFYYMHGEDVSRLTVFAQFNKRNNSAYWRKLWEVEGEMGQVWLRSSVTVEWMQPFRFVLRGRTGASFASDIAIDDISVTPGCTPSNESLPDDPTPAVEKCKDLQFACKTGRCISSALVCDFTPDCEDASDEDNCGPCDFELDACGWIDHSKGRVAWQRSQAMRKIWLGKDHTQGTGAGHVMMVNSEQQQGQESAQLWSPTLPPSSSACEVTMWLFYEEEKESLLIRHLIPGSQPTTIAQMKASSRWEKVAAAVPEYQGKDGRLELYLRLGNGVPERMVAVDNISFSRHCTSSSSLVDCDFDDPNFNDGLCHWRNSMKGGLSWTVQQGYGAGNETRPVADHTTGSGGYAHVSSGHTVSQNRALLESPVLLPTTSNGSCLSFWYYPYRGSTVLGVFTEPDKVLREPVRQSRTWVHRQHFIYTTDNYRIMIEAKPVDSISSVALDDVRLSPGACRRPSICDFEVDMCDWKPSAEGLSQGWQRRNGGGLTVGPYEDHTFASPYGHYIVTTAGRKGDRALLSSSAFEKVGERCIEFWYNMNGNLTGTLSVYQNASGFAILSMLKPIWKRSGNRHSTWSKGRASLSKFKNYRIVFEVLATAHVPKDYDGYIALDDIQLKTGPCTYSLACNFETDRCGWSSDKSRSDFLWEYLSAKDGSKLGGPSVDATTVTSHGSYMYARLSNVGKGNKAVLIAEEMNVRSPEGLCLKFQYYMQNSRGSALLVEAVYNGDKKIRMGRKSIATSSWKSATYSFYTAPGSTDVTLQLVLEAGENFTQNELSGVAVDDIEVQRNLCGQTTEAPSPAPTYLPHPLDCNFEEDNCSWANSPENTGKASWEMVSGTNFLRYTNLMPKVDHTTSSIYGTYLTLTGPTTQIDAVALTTKHEVSVEDDGLCIRFWYYMYGPALLPLGFYGTDSDGETMHWERRKSAGPQWNYGQAFVAGPRVLHLLFRSHVPASGAVALDDISADVGACPAPMFCGFESDECNWQPGLEGRYRWKRKSANEGGLPKDHTEGTASGHAFFVIFDPVSAHQATSAMAVSPLYSKEEASCLRFWYQIEGDHVLVAGTINDRFTTVSALLRRGTDGPGKWRAAQIGTQDKTTLRRRFFLRAVVKSQNGSVAVDDIQIRSQCSSLGSCNFEEDFCMWENEDLTTKPLSWTRSKGRSHLRGPEQDHTFGATYGTYAVVRSTDTQKSKYGSVLISPEVQNCIAGCFSFWLFRNGTLSHDLSIFIRSNGKDTVQEYKLAHDEEGLWVKGQLTLASNTPTCQIGFAPSFPSLRATYYALDDLELASKGCTPLEDSHHPSFTCDDGQTHLTRDKICDFVHDCNDGSDEAKCGLNCDFENGTCNWSKEDYSTQWVLQQAQSDSSGPTVDRTTLSGSGHYMKLKMSDGRGHVGYGRMVSPFLRNAAPTCRLIFWFYSTLTGEKSAVKVRTRAAASTLDRETTCLVVQGRTRPRWQRAEAVLGRISSRFAVSLVGSVNKGNMTFAIDHLSFESCTVLQLKTPQCDRVTKYQCANGNCIPRDMLCDFNDDCGDMSDEGNNPRAKCNVDAFGRCDFEDGTCDWIVDDRRWQLGRQQGLRTVHPSDDYRDHTTNSIYGNFLMFKFRFLPRGTTVAFKSPLLVASSSECSFRFYYSYSTLYWERDYDSYSKRSGSLQVAVRTDLLGSSKLLWKTSRVLGQYFERKVVHLGDIKGVFQLVVEGRAGTDVGGAWLVDDVSFSEGCRKADQESLPPQTPTPSPPSSTCQSGDFVCASGQCIDKTLVCDFKRDCVDGSDETHCASCSFDQDMCGWIDMSLGMFAWYRSIHGPNGEGPKSDKSGKGHFMSVERTGEGVVSEMSQMVTAPLGATAETCQAGFYYYISEPSGNDTLRLRVVDKSYSPLTLTSLGDDTGGQWAHATADVGKKSAPWNLQFEAEKRRATSRIAVDEVNLKGCAAVPAAPGNKCNATGKVACPGDGEQCIDASEICDFAKDCTDGSDEAACDTYPERCDFENGTCGWSMSKGISAGGATWVVDSPQPSVGMIGDHTHKDQSGHMLCLKRKDLAQKSVAGIQSVLFDKTTSKNCHLRLWHFMANGDTDVLRVFVKPKTMKQSFVLSTTRGDQGGHWQKLDVALSSPGPFRIGLVGLQDAGSQGVLAVDDISFTPDCASLRNGTVPPPEPVHPPGHCNVETEFTCEDNSCIPKDTVCDFKEDCPRGRDEKTCPSSCNFEDENECGWRGPKHPTPYVYWKVATALDARNYNPEAPPIDVTTRSDQGDYLMVWASQSAGKVIDPFRVVSPTFQQATPDCKVSLSYWLYLPLLHVKIMAVSDGKEDVLFTQESKPSKLSKPKAWNSIVTGIGRRKRPFQVVLEVTVLTRGGGSLFAMDDFHFVDCGYPKQIPAGVSCSSSEQRCADGRRCVPKNSLCDLFDDCSDGSDEVECQNIRITFDNGTFGELQQGQGAFHWTFHRGPSPQRDRDNSGPMFDHTTSSDAGMYIQYGGSYHEYNAPSYLYSPVLLPGKCRVTFHVHMFGREVYILDVLKHYPGSRGEDISIWNEKGPVGDFWMRRMVELDEEKEFQVVFVARAGNGPSDVIALDDISFGEECRPKETSIVTTSGPTANPSTKAAVITTTSSTPGSADLPSTCSRGHFDCGGSCIPNLLVCDQVLDCPDAQDEKNCTDRQPCPGEQFYCPVVELSQCLPHSMLCDGHEDCSDGSDESLCGLCPIGFCRNSGICQLLEPDGLPSCDCKEGYQGGRCSRGLTVGPEPVINQSSTTSPWTVGAPVLALLLVTVAGIVAVYVYKRRARSEDEVMFSISNPTYGVQMEDLSLSTPSEVDSPGAMAMENPVYGIVQSRGEARC